MINGINISNIFVFDQNEALDFYVGKLGLEVSGDMDFGGMRWLTVRPAGVTNREILLELVGPPNMDPQTAAQARDLISKGAGGFTAGFTVTDCRAFYEDLKAKGVEITQEPTEQFYGTDMGLRDPFGNHIRVVQLNQPG